MSAMEPRSYVSVILLSGWLLMLPHVYKKKDGSYDPDTKALTLGINGAVRYCG